MTETRRASLSFFIFLSLLLQEFNAMPGVILTDLARAKSGADCWSCCRLLRHVIAPAVNSCIFYSSACRWGWTIAPDPTCKSKFCPRRFWTLLEKAEVGLILFSSINIY